MQLCKLNSYKDISLSVEKVLHVSLVNERRKNNGSYDSKIKDQCCEIDREHKSVECEEMKLVLFIEI